MTRVGRNESRERHTVRMEERRLEFHLRGHVWIFLGEGEESTEEAS